MNTKPSITDNSSSPYDARIDAALHIYSRAVPAPDLETRILTQVSAAQHRTPDHGYGSISGWRILLVQRLPRGVLGGALATAAGWAIVVGTLHHSSLHANLPQSARTTTTGGVSTGGGIHIPTQVTPERQGIDPAAARTPAHGRAIVSPNRGHRSAGAAVPRSPYSPDQQPNQPSASPQQ